ncbi:hypothetical protein [Bacillus sp. B15-48]|uniref:hypothetical protein n=1 Tax=Bacillus sp. B15-48 TaxID=1548601 RepID=UPI00193F6392|nr:hypothetical protein [Bacillus sp. B15-48]MBM4761999.1 hypothetical protein [Bacillus sp. B15-48]
MTIYDDNDLLEDYRKLWNNRQLTNEKLEPQGILKEAIIRELRDENSHPRVRKTFYEKYYLATKRIVNSSINNEAKLKLIQLHIEYLSKLNDEKET